MTPRAAAMTAEDRRKAIIEVLIPLLVEKGSEVSTREIAEAAGIAEGTIFRVFPDKRSLMLAAAEEVINPAGGQADFDRAGARPHADDHDRDDGGPESPHGRPRGAPPPAGRRRQARDGPAAVRAQGAGEPAPAPHGALRAPPRRARGVARRR